MSILQPEEWARTASQTASDMAQSTRALRTSTEALAISAATPDGRAELEQLRVNFKAIHGASLECAQECGLAVRAIDKALRRRRWGIRA